MSALHRACIGGHVGIAKLLLKNTADPNLQDKESNTPLHYAAMVGSEACCAALLAGGAQLNIMNRHSKLAADVASEPAIVKMLQAQ